MRAGPHHSVPSPGVITRPSAVGNDLAARGVESYWLDRDRVPGGQERPIRSGPSPRLQPTTIEGVADEDEALPVESQCSIEEAGKVRRLEQRPILAIPTPCLDGRTGRGGWPTEREAWG